MENCIFCKILNGKIQSDKVYEDKDVLAFLDINPVNKGHTLVITKSHYETMLDIPDDRLKGFMIGVKKVSKAVKEGVRADGININMNNYKAAGQLVFHVHFHIIPRYEGDNVVRWSHKEYDKNEANKVAEKIRSKL